MFEPINILIIDDEKQIGEIYKKILSAADKSFSNQIFLCESVIEAKEILYEEKIDVVLLDLFLKETLSIATIEAFRSISNLPFIVVTGHDVPGLSKICFELEASDFLIKPVDAVTLFKSCIYAVERERVKLAQIKSRSELQKHRELAKKYLDVANIILLVMDEQGTIDTVNKYGCDLLGYSFDELVGSNWVNMVVPEGEREAAWEYLKETVASFGSGKLNEYQNSIKTKEGKFRTILWRNSVLQLGNTIRVVRSGTDITEKEKLTQRRKLLVNILRVLNKTYSGYETLSNLIELIKDHTKVAAIAIRLKNKEDYPYVVSLGFAKEFIDLDEDLMGVDGELECICGTVISEKNKGDCIHFTEYGSFWTNNLSRVLKTDCKKTKIFRDGCLLQGYRSMILVPLKSSTEIIGLLHLADPRENLLAEDSVLFLEELVISIVVAIQRFYQEDKMRKMEIAKTMDLLQSSRLLNSGIAHELRTPMQAMLNCLELIQEEVSIDCTKQTEELFDCIQECPFRRELLSIRDIVLDLVADGINRTKYSVRVLNSLAEYSKIATDQEEHLLEPVKELNVIIRTLRFTDQFKSLNKNEFKLKDNLNSSYNYKIKMSSVDFSQLITNLCRNSREAITHKNPEILIVAEHEEEWFIIRVIDNGRGIEEGVGKKIFEPYFSTKSNPSNYNQGLGLAMVRDIVVAYSGTLDYNSVPGRTEFIIKFPCYH